MRLRPYETSFDLDRSLGGDAGDLLPTWITPSDALRYIDEVESGYTVLGLAIQQSAVSPEWKTLWDKHLEGWQKFRDDARSTMAQWWAMNAKAITEQTDRWGKQLQSWREDFKAQGGVILPPPTTDPGQGVPDATLESWAKVAAILGGVAALFVIVRELK